MTGCRKAAEHLRELARQWGTNQPVGEDVGQDEAAPPGQRVVGAGNPECNMVRQRLDLEAQIIAPLAQAGDAEVDRSVEDLFDRPARALLSQPDAQSAAGTQQAG